MVVPSGDSVVSQLNPNGALVSVAYSEPFTHSSTRATLVLSLTDTLTGTTPETLLPPVGEVMESVGGVLSVAVVCRAWETAAAALIRPQP